MCGHGHRHAALGAMPVCQMSWWNVLALCAFAYCCCCSHARCRALVAVGTLAGEHSKVRGLARELGFLPLTGSLKTAGGKVGEVAAEVAQKLRL